jgi:DNA-binding transcriptional MocR family regulator
LVEWAEDGERLIVEDDFDGEYRYDGSGLAALQGLAPDRVAYVGSASKRLTPGMRLGWMLLPSWLAWPLIQAKAVEDGGSEAIGQLALHDFIERGELDRHIRRMRLRYQRRREALLETLARRLPQARVGAGAAGLYELAELPETSTRPFSWPPRPSAAWVSTAFRCIASARPAHPAWCSVSPACPSLRWTTASVSWPRRCEVSKGKGHCASTSF